MDICYEYMVKKEKNALDWVKIAGITVLALALSVICAILFLSLDSLFTGVILVLFVGVWWGYIQLVRGLNIEYEYTITNNELDIDVIKGKTRRKHITTINLKKADFVGDRDNAATREAMSASGEPSKKYTFAADEKAGRVFVTDVISKKDNSKIRVYFSVDEKLAEYIRLANPKAYKG